MKRKLQSEDFPVLGSLVAIFFIIRRIDKKRGIKPGKMKTNIWRSLLKKALLVRRVRAPHLFSSRDVTLFSCGLLDCDLGDFHYPHLDTLVKLIEIAVNGELRIDTLNAIMDNFPDGGLGQSKDNLKESLSSTIRDVQNFVDVEMEDAKK